MSNFLIPHDQSIADWMAQRAHEDGTFDPIQHLGFLRRATEDGLVREGVTGTALEAEMAKFDAAAKRFFAGEPAPAAATAPAATPGRRKKRRVPRIGHLGALSNDYYAKEIVEWMSRREVRDDDLLSYEQLLAIQRKVKSDLRREQGADEESIAAELARFDAAAEAWLKAAAALEAEGQSEPGPPERLGVSGAILATGGAAIVAMSIAAVIYRSLEILIYLRELSVATAMAVSAVPAVLAFLAGTPLLASMFRANGITLGARLVFVIACFVCFAWPAAFYGGFVRSMGIDFRYLAWPVAAFVGLVASLPALMVLFGRFVKDPPAAAAQPETGDEPAGPGVRFVVFLIMVAIASLPVALIFGAGTAASACGGLFLAALLMRSIIPNEVHPAAIAGLSVPLALFAAELPPGLLSVLAVAGAGVAAAALGALALRLTGRRRTAFYSGVSASALSLLLVMIPTGPAPGIWLSEQLGHPLSGAARATMQGFGHLYESEYSKGLIAALGGFRTGSAEVRGNGRVDHDASRGVALDLEVLNRGEAGIERLVVYLGPVDGTSTPSCGLPQVEQRFDPPLWPGETVILRASYPTTAGCSKEQTEALAQRIQEDLNALGHGHRFRSLVLATRPNDPVSRFREDARAWLDL